MRGNAEVAAKYGIRETTVLPLAFPKKKTGQFTPMTELGKKLQLLRNRAIDEGMKLYSCDEILSKIETERKT